jgi:hypothetical protein
MLQDDMHARDVARRRYLAEQRDTGTPAPKPVPLAALLAEPDEPTAYLVDQLWPLGGRVVLAAQYKAGKTTARDNLVRSLVDGAPFLGRYTVARPMPAGRTVVVLDLEMPRNTLRTWLRDQDIAHAERVIVWPLRGHTARLDLTDDAVRAWWAGELRRVGALVLDCLRPVLDALGLDENRDAGRFLTAFDALCAEAGVTEALVVHHMGHTGERARGDSRLRDWPDAEWRLIREQGDGGREPDAGAGRYFAALGRDVDVPEQAIAYDPRTRGLLVTGGSRADQKARAAADAIVGLLADTGGALSTRGIEDEMAERDPDHARADIRRGLRIAVDDGRIVTQPGPRRAVLHTVSAPVRRSAPGRTGAVESECASVPPPIGGRTGALDAETAATDTLTDLLGATLLSAPPLDGEAPA